MLRFYKNAGSPQFCEVVGFEKWPATWFSYEAGISSVYLKSHKDRQRSCWNLEEDDEVLHNIGRSTMRFSDGHLLVYFMLLRLLNEKGLREAALAFIKHCEEGP